MDVIWAKVGTFSLTRNLERKSWSGTVLRRRRHVCYKFRILLDPNEVRFALPCERIKCFVSSTTCFYELLTLFDQNKVRFPLPGERTVNEGNGVFCIVDDMVFWVAGDIWSKQGTFPLTRWMNRERRKWSVLYRRRHVFMSCGRYLIKTRYVSPYPVNEPWTKETECFVSATTCLYELRMLCDQNKVRFPLLRERYKTMCFVSVMMYFVMIFDQNKVRFGFARLLNNSLTIASQ